MDISGLFDQIKEGLPAGWFFLTMERRGNKNPIPGIIGGLVVAIVMGISAGAMGAYVAVNVLDSRLTSLEKRTDQDRIDMARRVERLESQHFKDH